MDNENDVIFGKIKGYEASTREFGKLIKEFSMSKNSELKKYITENIHGKSQIRQAQKQVYETPSQTIYTESSWRILSYTKNPKWSNPILLIPSLINRYYILDLMENASFVKFLSEKGVNVYLLDWGIPGPEHDHLELSTYVFKWIGRAVRKVLNHANAENLTMMGYCMGATIAALYASKNQDLVNGFISLAAPYDFSGEDALTVMAKSMDVDKMLECHGEMSADLMQSGFMIAQPTSVYFKMKSLAENGNNEKRNNTFMHLERWLADNVSFPKEAYREYIKKFYQQNLLAKDELTLSDEKILLSDIKIPILSVIASKDNIVMKNAALALNEKVKSTQKDIIEVEAGHIGIIMGRKAKVAWEGIFDWFKKINVIK
ncbi:MAG: alpha/beta fold hydrolase [Candidatus Muirbacterium halophilum]|nr:alpha/beta fold hydrolase [Candidatus Muirbacterium halophilum]MCK9476684.1 alpha/beta fold hydrolase [Candidatus Muirbacterium halophilum]